jgi:hypothetical protein
MHSQDEAAAREMAEKSDDSQQFIQASKQQPSEQYKHD